MVKYFDAIGYGGTVEEPPDSGKWVEKITEFKCYGDVIRNTRDLRDGDHLNQDLSVGNSISIVADAYARENFFAIRYARWAGTLWTVVNVEVQSPRLILRLGGVYNGPTPAASSDS